ncbi:hypothetical protein BOTCAL_0346g00020 [Botryotinia calthae]|uniref:Uncharacterized protein n=1 Tax=Botryotinia calthae TaxID=38488 RepID=A0A4Y8CTD9_9HELO|nr:hypothetical protein BOTCAL_0346g00020 [Botryotinia calthae]
MYSEHLAGSTFNSGWVAIAVGAHASYYGSLIARIFGMQIVSNHEPARNGPLSLRHKDYHARKLFPESAEESARLLVYPQIQMGLTGHIIDTPKGWQVFTLTLAQEQA